MLNIDKSLKNYFIFNILFLLSNCIVKIPLNYYPIDNKNFSDPSGIFEYYVDQMAYANFEIGSKRQKVQIPLRFDTNEFYIVDNSSFIYDPKKFSGFKMYNLSNSETYDIIDEEMSYGECFQMAYYYKDDFYFNNKAYSLNFYLTLSYDGHDSGGIGMQLNPYSNMYEFSKGKAFLDELNKVELKKKNIWTIFYNSKKNILEDEGFILIGGFPEELNSSLGYYKKDFFKKEKNSINMLISKLSSYERFDFGFEIDAIYGYKGNKDQIIDDFLNGNINYKIVHLNYNSGGISLPNALNKYYTDVFEKYLNIKQCFQGRYNGYSNYFYYCKKDKKIIKEIKNSFPRIILKSNDLTFNFTLEAEDVLIEQNNYVICLIYFSTTTGDNSFKFGKPFLKKYLFSFNYENKEVYFYKPEEKEKENDNGITIVLLIIIIITVIIVVSVISFFLFKFILYEKIFKKKRAEELNDDDYDYTSKENMGNDALNINTEN